jgi:uncharacterized protein
VSDFGLLLVGLAIMVAIAGIVVPILPGALLAWAAILVWAIAERSPEGWAVLVAATGLIGIAQVVKYLVPGRRLREAGVHRSSMVAGVVVGVAGFFLIPVVGLFVGFPAGVYVGERVRLGTHGAAWASTRHAVKAVGLSILIELAATLLCAGLWLAAVLT